MITRSRQGNIGCIPKNCVDAHAQCGPATDGCGGTLHCGLCQSPQVCVDGECVNSGCIPVTCEQQGWQCGLAPDGCGGVIDCGKCRYGDVCGAAGPNRCGTVPESHLDRTRVFGRSPVYTTARRGSVGEVPGAGNKPEPSSASSTPGRSKSIRAQAAAQKSQLENKVSTDFMVEKAKDDAADQQNTKSASSSVWTVIAIAVGIAAVGGVGYLALSGTSRKNPFKKARKPTRNEIAADRVAQAIRQGHILMAYNAVDHEETTIGPYQTALGVGQNFAVIGIKRPQREFRTAEEAAWYFTTSVVGSGRANDVAKKALTGKYPVGRIVKA